MSLEDANQALRHYRDVETNSIKLSYLPYYDEKPKVGEWFFEEESFKDYGDIIIFKILKIRPGSFKNSQGHQQWTMDVFVFSNTDNDDTTDRSLKASVSTRSLGKDKSGQYSTGANRIL